MKVLRVYDATWLPSRHRFALSKLIALSLFKEKPAEGGRMFALDRDQSGHELFPVAAWLLLTLTVDLAALLPLRPWAATTVAILAAPWLIQLPMYVFGTIITLPRAANQAMNSAATMLFVAVLSAFVAFHPGPARYVAWLFFGIVALNAVAWVIVRLLRQRIRALEERCGV
jgi:hypothetical protein